MFITYLKAVNLWVQKVLMVQRGLRGLSKKNVSLNFNAHHNVLLFSAENQTYSPTVDMS
jgi:hypothetical protein